MFLHYENLKSRFLFLPGIRAYKFILLIYFTIIHLLFNVSEQNSLLKKQV